MTVCLVFLDTATAMREGRKEERNQIARNMLAIQIPVDQIAKVTGLSESEIKALQQ